VRQIILCLLLPTSLVSRRLLLARESNAATQSTAIPYTATASWREYSSESSRREQELQFCTGALTLLLEQCFPPLFRHRVLACTPSPTGPFQTSKSAGSARSPPFTASASWRENSSRARAAGPLVSPPPNLECCRQFEVATHFFQGRLDISDTYCDDIRTIAFKYFFSPRGFWFDCTTSLPWSINDFFSYQVLSGSQGRLQAWIRRLPLPAGEIARGRMDVNFRIISGRLP
jgi:hypothetical protein